MADKRNYECLRCGHITGKGPSMRNHLKTAHNENGTKQGVNYKRTGKARTNPHYRNKKRNRKVKTTRPIKADPKEVVININTPPDVKVRITSNGMAPVTIG